MRQTANWLCKLSQAEQRKTVYLIILVGQFFVLCGFGGFYGTTRWQLKCGRFLGSGCFSLSDVVWQQSFLAHAYIASMLNWEGCGVAVHTKHKFTTSTLKQQHTNFWSTDILGQKREKPKAWALN